MCKFNGNVESVFLMGENGASKQNEAKAMFDGSDLFNDKPDGNEGIQFEMLGPQNLVTFLWIIFSIVQPFDLCYSTNICF